MKLTGKEPWCGKRIDRLFDIDAAACHGQSLIGNVVWAMRPRPAAFVIGMTGNTILGGIMKGLWIFKSGEAAKPFWEQIRKEQAACLM